jgi:hypothetical protein
MSEKYEIQDEMKLMEGTPIKDTRVSVSMTI